VPSALAGDNTSSKPVQRIAKKSLTSARNNFMMKKDLAENAG
jgi:hypothetical protein